MLGADSSDVEVELAAARHQPEELEQLLARTKFSKRELQSLYRSFKSVSWGGPHPQRSCTRAVASPVPTSLPGVSQRPCG